MLVFEDDFGNKLYKKKVKKHGKEGIQYFAKNIKNQLVDERGLSIMMKEAGVFREYQMTAISPRGARIRRYSMTEKIIPIKVI